MKTYIFDQDIGEGSVMVYHVKGINKKDAQKRVEKMLKAGKIVPEEGETRIRRVEKHDDDGTVHLIFKLF